MKAVQIDFIEPRAWKFIWTAASVAFLLIIATTFMSVWQLRQQKVDLEQKLASFQALQLERLNKKKAAQDVGSNPRAASEGAANRLLQRDWNLLYDTIETPALSKIRLVQMSFDAVTGVAMLEYELNDMTQAADVARALDEASGSSGLWRLERLENDAQFSSAVGLGKVKGFWRASLD